MALGTALKSEHDTLLLDAKKLNYETDFVHPSPAPRMPEEHGEHDVYLRFTEGNPSEIERVTPMQDITLPHYLEKHADGNIRVAGHRISLHVFAEEFLNDQEVQRKSYAELARRFPTLDVATLTKLVQFCIGHEASILRYLAKQRDIAGRLREHGRRAPSLDELRRRRQ